ncbi:MAG: pyridoxal 5'-phosphate synthase glutaminase subunit PdxT [Caldisericia bacterium]|nr:pyridoxal 5'-phosphate synthase glutaminase subunit PdxT [Caldisericia bacterium]MDD4614741.1 pyridoxal 5'-phosphate synthase glutaminase subunit PdxT [Caldisericia bacterium]
MKIGILGFQGSIEEHECVFRRLSIATKRVKTPQDLEDIDGIVLPGGESTHMLRLLHFNALWDPLRKVIQKGLPTLATCAGVVLLSQTIDNTKQEALHLLDVVVSRNGYGPQFFSFVEEVCIEGFTEKFRAVFIRAPIVRSLNPNISILSEDREHNPIFVRQDNIFGLTFHPEIGNDDRIHSMFIQSIT